MLSKFTAWAAAGGTAANVALLIMPAKELDPELRGTSHGNAELLHADRYAEVQSCMSRSAAPVLSGPQGTCQTGFECFRSFANGN